MKKLRWVLLKSRSNHTKEKRRLETLDQHNARLYCAYLIKAGGHINAPGDIFDDDAALPAVYTPQIVGKLNAHAGEVQVPPATFLPGIVLATALPPAP